MDVKGVEAPRNVAAPASTLRKFHMMRPVSSVYVTPGDVFPVIHVFRHVAPVRIVDIANAADLPGQAIIHAHGRKRIGTPFAPCSGTCHPTEGNEERTIVPAECP
jgi:hypothetical protein